MYQKPYTCTEQGRTQGGGGVGGSNPPIGLSTKMYKKKITFLALLSLFFCNDTDSKVIWSNFWSI